MADEIMGYNPPWARGIFGDYPVRRYNVDERNRTNWGNDLGLMIDEKRDEIDKYVNEKTRSLGGENSEYGRYFLSFRDYIEDKLDDADDPNTFVRLFLTQYGQPKNFGFSNGKTIMRDLARKMLKLRNMLRSYNGAVDEEEDVPEEAFVPGNGGGIVYPPTEPTEPSRSGLEPIELPDNDFSDYPEIPSGEIDLTRRRIGRPTTQKELRKWMRQMKKAGYTDEEIIEIMNSYMNGYRSGGKLVKRR